MASDYTFLYLFQISDEERYWVITEICSEPSAVKRIKIIKQFIRIASK
jgi:Rap guanine nucleotide exchange factor 2